MQIKDLRHNAIVKVTLRINKHNFISTSRALCRPVVEDDRQFMHKQLSKLGGYTNINN